MESSVGVLQNSDERSTAGFSFWMNKIKGVASQVNRAGVGNRKAVDVKNMMQGKSDQEESKKKKLCMCSPTNHPGSFRCRYHRSTSTQKVKPVQLAARDNLKLKSINAKPNPLSAGGKPTLSTGLARHVWLDRSFQDDNMNYFLGRGIGYVSSSFSISDSLFDAVCY